MNWDLTLLTTDTRIDWVITPLFVFQIPQKDDYGEPLCVKFRARQDHAVGNVQPQTVKVYDYYENEGNQINV